jgi:hypothetical protein
VSGSDFYFFGGKVSSFWGKKNKIEKRICCCKFLALKRKKIGLKTK